MTRRQLLQIACVGFAVCTLACNAHEAEHAGRKGTPELAARSSLASCPHSDITQSGWLEAKSRDGRLTFRVPQRYSESHAGSSEVWLFQDGSVGYQLVPRDKLWEDSLLTDSTASAQGWCHARVDGRMALIQFTYATPATGPGYYLSELLPLDSARGLRLSGFIRDTLRARELLEIARSVRVNVQ